MLCYVGYANTNTNTNTSTNLPPHNKIYASFGTGDGDLNIGSRGKGVPGPGKYPLAVDPKHGPSFSFGGKGSLRT